MPEMKPEPGPDQPASSAERPVASSEITAWRPTAHGAPYPAEMPPFAEVPMPWESDETLAEGRLPGTRRLWLAGGLAIAVLIATATAIAVLDNGSDTSSQDEANLPVADTGLPFIPGAAAAAPTGKTALSSPVPSPSTPQGAASPNSPGEGPAEPAPAPPEPTVTGKASAPAPAAARTSVQSVDQPDRYWHLSDGVVRLDQVSGSSPEAIRRDASFTKVTGLADSSCYSFVTADGSYLRHRDFVLRAERTDGSALFKQDATFCPRPTSSAGAVMLEAVNHPGHYLHDRDFQLRLERYDNDDHRRDDHRDRESWAFRLVKGLG
ncbi:AbfB domain-containing protein [Streptomyces sp. NPDC005808]|uniref:AbfB domain-containing protein n=1 Tax=Streptomyces sp. NPDC005808 TaxID=3364734 RepID=UPI0036918FA7